MEVNVFEFGGSGHKKDYYFLLASDLHIGHPYWDEKRFKKDFEFAKKHNAMIFINGDTCDGILNKDMKRFTAASAKKMRARDNPINQYREMIVEELKPYVNHIALIGVGNHETKLMKYNGFDIIEAVIDDLNILRKPELKPIVHGGYTGFIRFIFKYCSENSKHHSRMYTIYYNHGQGGAAPVTHGAIDLDRRQHIQADVIWMGHKHKKTIIELPSKISLDRLGKIREQETKGIITGCYITNIHQYDISEGYEIDFGEESQVRPQARGGVILKIRYDSRYLHSSVII